MDYNTLGDSDLKVSRICLGTMTWGKQNSQDEAFEQLDYALDYGVNFIDTAEMYAVPPSAETYGKTEAYIGNWIAARNNRDRFILATKVIGPAPGSDWIRDGTPRLNRTHIEQAVDASLKRLQTDYIDLYQLHWPDRPTNFFGQLGYTHIECPNVSTTPIEETLGTLHDLVNAGKIRYIGISNETPWGMMQYLRLAERNDWPKIISIQNPYNLLNRSFEVGLAEMAHRENVPLLAYSPLAFGVLSGKYRNGARPAGARLTLFERFARYTNEQAVWATERYLELAEKHGLNPSQMALAYVNSRSFLGSNIIGATSMEQLQINLESSEVELSKEVLKDIEAIHEKQPNPAP